MTTKNKITLTLIMTIMAVALVSNALPSTQATQSWVNITFTASGYSNYSGAVLTISNTSTTTTYSTWNLPVTLSMKVGNTYTVTTSSSITGWDSVVYSFSSWTNGNGLVTNSGTFTVPSSSTTVTATYAKSTYTAKFATSGLSSISNNMLRIDGTDYTISTLASTSFLWAVGSTHNIVALNPVYSYDTPNKGYNFSSWTNGNGLTTASGTFTMPASDVTVTANYAQSTVQVTFSSTGLSNLNLDTVLTIDGTSYTYSNIANIKYQWMTGSTHTITAASSITGWDTIKHDFSSWTNGNGLTTASGTFTTPSSDVIVTINYVTSSSTSYKATFSTSGLPNISGYLLEIDGTNYTPATLASNSFNWAGGSTHTIRALQPVYSYDTPSKGFNFSSWTNGNGLTGISGTFTMPSSDVTVTANYVQSTVQVTFSTSGLSNLNSDTILTIDGTSYDYWAIANFKAQWMIGSIHTVTATTSITGWDSVTHYFSSWTNGNGLTGVSGTFATPNSDVAVTVTYASTATSITITCTNSTVDKGYATIIHGTLLSGTIGLSAKTITLSYYNGSVWCNIGSTTTASDGTYSYTWTVPASLENGVYPVKATFAGDSTYPTCSATTGSVGNGVSLSVLPESWGSIVALAACFAGTLVFIKLRSKQKSR
jgi:hypothetical protein